MNAPLRVLCLLSLVALLATPATAEVAYYSTYYSPAAGVCCGDGQTYRIVYQTVYEQQQVTAYRIEYETVCEERQVTSYKPVWETQVRENRYQGGQADHETAEREEAYTVTRPVYETQFRDASYNRVRIVQETAEREESYTVSRPVYETAEREECYTVRGPSTRPLPHRVSDRDAAGDDLPHGIRRSRALRRADGPQAGPAGHEADLAAGRLRHRSGDRRDVSAARGAVLAAVAGRAL